MPDVFVGTVVFDLLLDDVRSLKGKRALVKPLLTELKRLDVAAAETGHLGLYRRAEVAVAALSIDHGHVKRVLGNAERIVSEHPEFEVLSAHTMVRSEHDEWEV